MSAGQLAGECVDRPREVVHVVSEERPAAMGHRPLCVSELQRSVRVGHVGEKLRQIAAVALVQHLLPRAQRQ